MQILLYPVTPFKVVEGDNNASNQAVGCVNWKTILVFFVLTKRLTSFQFLFKKELSVKYADLLQWYRIPSFIISFRCYFMTYKNNFHAERKMNENETVFCSVGVFEHEHVCMCVCLCVFANIFLSQYIIVRFYIHIHNLELISS